MLTKIKNFFGLYFGAAPSNSTTHDANIVRVCTYAAHVLLVVGALTSLPALFSSFLSLWIAIFGDGSIAFGFAITLASAMSVGVIYLVDMQLSALAPYTFKKVGETIEQPRRSPRHYTILVLLAILCGFLASLSMSFSYNGNEALMEVLYPASKDQHRKAIELDSQKIATKTAIENRYSSRIAAAQKTDAAAIETAKKEGRAMVKNAIAAAHEKYKGQYNLYKVYSPTIIGKGKEDSAAHVSKVVLTAAPLINSQNTELAEVEHTFNVSKMAHDDHEKAEAARRKKQIDAVFMLTGGLGSYSTLLGLGTLLLSVLIGWKSQVAKTPPIYTGGFDPKKEIAEVKRKLSAEIDRLNKRIEAKGDPSTPARNCLGLWDELEALDQDEFDAACKRFAALGLIYDRGSLQALS